MHAFSLITILSLVATPLALNSLPGPPLMAEPEGEGKPPSEATSTTTTLTTIKTSITKTVLPVLSSTAVTITKSSKHSTSGTFLTAHPSLSNSVRSRPLPSSRAPSPTPSSAIPPPAPQRPPIERPPPKFLPPTRPFPKRPPPKRPPPPPPPPVVPPPDFPFPPHPCVRQHPEPLKEEAELRWRTFVNQLLHNKNVSAAFEFIVEDYINHSGAVENGFYPAWNFVSAIWYQKKHDIHILKEYFQEHKFTSDYGWIQYKVDQLVINDRFRWEGGCIVEHWDETAFPVPVLNPPN